MKVMNHTKKLISLVFAASLVAATLTPMNVAGYGEGSVTFESTDTHFALNVQSTPPSDENQQWRLTLFVFWDVTHTFPLPSKSPKIMFRAGENCGDIIKISTSDIGLNCGTTHRLICQSGKPFDGQVIIEKFGPLGEVASLSWKLDMTHNLKKSAACDEKTTYVNNVHSSFKFDFPKYAGSYLEQLYPITALA
jgi:hypothetical protein